MRSALNFFKVAMVGIVASQIVGCASFGPDTTEKWQGNVWRAVVSKQVLDTRKPLAYSSEILAKIDYKPERDIGYRAVHVHFSSGWDSVIAVALVPDQIEFSKLKRGTLVDVMAEKGPDSSFETQRFTRVIRVVCDADDKECWSAEKKADRVRQIIDTKPDGARINSEYGLTFNRKVTAEDLKKYD